MYERIQNKRYLYRELEQFMDKYASMKGVRVLRILLREPNTPIDVIDLTLRLRFANPRQKVVEKFKAAAFPDIPMADGKALGQYKNRMNQLIARKARRLAEEEGADCSDLDWEIGWLKRELRNITKPNGDIKNINPDKKKAYMSYRNAMVRLLNKAREENPAVWDLVRRSLVCGKTFIWLDNQG
ncbi:MAG: hypothetical protein K0B87_00545 [Candidatus Syntrophosphaera sp.]|nr:hypothetical protein [Candidatus Syntrophosphaera sp.]